MFNWFKRKKKPTADEILKAKLAKSLENYVPEEDKEDTDSTFTDIDIDGGTVSVRKIRAKPIEELTLTEFETNITVVGVDRDDDDPWAVNHADTTQWHRARKHGK